MANYDDFEVDNLDIAENFYKLGKHKECMDICLDVIANNPKSAQAYNLLGASMLEMQRYKKAIDCFANAYHLSPDNSHYVTNLAKAHWFDSDNEKAIKTLSQFLNKSNDMMVLFDLAKYFSHNNEYYKAIDIYRALCVIEPDNVQFLFMLADEYIKNNDMKNSIPFLEKAYNLGHQEAGLKLLNQYIKLNMIKEAIIFAKKYTYKKNADFYFLYASALSLNGSIADAKNCYKIAISMSNKPRYVFGYAIFLLKNREYKEGFKYYEKRREIQGFSSININRAFSKPSDIENKKVLVYYEQNISDTIIFSRFLTRLQQIAKKVYFYPQKEIANIFNTECVSSLNIDYDIAIPLPSLPYILNVSKASDLDVKSPLKAPLFNKKTKANSTMSIALAFSDLGKMKYNKMKLERILDVLLGMNINIISVKLEGIDSFYFKNFNIIDKGAECKDYKDVLKVLNGVDLFIGTDTIYLHLAANLNIPSILFKDTQRWIWEDSKKTNWYKNLIMLGPDENLRWDNALKSAFKYVKKYVSKN